MNGEKIETVLSLCSFASGRHAGVARTLLAGNPAVTSESDVREAVEKINKIPSERMSRLTSEELAREFGLAKVIWWEG